MTATATASVRTVSSGAGALRMVPEAILPEQLFGVFDGGADLVPEKALRLAVLASAVFDYQCHCTAESVLGRREFHRAQTWIDAEDRVWPYSFRNLCEALGLDADYIRRGLHEFRARQRMVPAGARARSRHAFRRSVGIRTLARGRAAGLHDGRRRRDQRFALARLEPASAP